MHEIFAGFAENIDELSQKTKNHSKVDYIDGKAPYAGPIHLEILTEYPHPGFNRGVIGFHSADARGF